MDPKPTMDSAITPERPVPGGVRPAGTTPVSDPDDFSTAGPAPALDDHDDHDDHDDDGPPAPSGRRAAVPGRSSVDWPQVRDFMKRHPVAGGVAVWLALGLLRRLVRR